MSYILELVILLILLWIIGIMALAPRLAKTKHFQAYGPLLLVKFVKNRGVLDKVAKKYPGHAFGKVSVIIVIVSTVLAFALLIYGAYLSLFITPSNAPSLSLLLFLPGVNPAIPIGFGAAALIISVVIHEFFHGITARNHGIKVNSVGVLFFIIPMGAFVEPDEEEVEKADPVHRRRLIAAGPGINIVIAAITFFLVALLLVPAATPTHNGFYVQTIDSSSPSANYIGVGSEVISFGNYTGNSVTTMILDSQLVPGNMYNISVYNGKSVVSYDLPAGMVIDTVSSGTAAANASLPVGSIIYSVNGTMVHNDPQLSSILDGITPGTTINMTLLQYTMVSGSLVASQVYRNVTTMSKYDYYAQNYPADNSPEYRNQSFLGVTTSYAGMLGFNLSYMKTLLSGQQIFSSPWTAGLQFIALPFVYFYPVPTALASLFTVPFNSTLFWGIVDMMYWLFWVDFLLGITNALPFAIFDGGQFFRDTLIIASKGERFRFLRNEKTMRGIMNAMSLLVAILLLWQVIVPRII